MAENEEQVPKDKGEPLATAAGTTFTGGFIMRVIDIDELALCDSFPKYPDKDITVDIKNIDIANSLIVYVSHRWLRSKTVNGETGCTGEAHPDDAENNHFKLTVKGVKQAFETLSPGMSNCYVWIDYSCLGQSNGEVEDFKHRGNMGRIIRYCDCLFTPLHEPKQTDGSPGWSYPSKVTNWYEEYGAKTWNEGPDAFMNRAWCRVELFYGAVTPLLSAGVRNPGKEKYLHFDASLKLHAINEKRPNLLYGSNESKKNLRPIVLPPLQTVHLGTYDPLEGYLTNEESDMPVIQRLMDELRHLIRRPRAGYVGERDEATGKLHGTGVYTYANGDVYSGEFVNDRMCGDGTYTSVDGTEYVGGFKNDTMNGKGRYVSASGAVYEGEYVNGRRSGHGKYTYASGATYEGTFLDDQMHGRGVYTATDGSTYEGGYMFDQMHDVQGTYKAADGSMFVGGFSEGKKHGNGVLTMANGKIFRGAYVDGKKHGIATIETPGGKVRHVQYIEGNRVSSDLSQMTDMTLNPSSTKISPR